jgi:hypothetical protein
MSNPCNSPTQQLELTQPSQFGSLNAGMPFVFSEGTSKVSTTF